MITSPSTPSAPCLHLFLNITQSMSESTYNRELSSENFREQVLAIKRTIIEAWISDFPQISLSPESFSSVTAHPQRRRRQRSLKSRRMMEDNAEPRRRSKRLFIATEPLRATRDFNRQDVANTNKETTTGCKSEGSRRRNIQTMSSAGTAKRCIELSTNIEFTHSGNHIERFSKPDD